MDGEKYEKSLRDLDELAYLIESKYGKFDIVDGQFKFYSMLVNEKKIEEVAYDDKNPIENKMVPKNTAVMQNVSKAFNVGEVQNIAETQNITETQNIASLRNYQNWGVCTYREVAACTFMFFDNRTLKSAGCASKGFNALQKQEENRRASPGRNRLT